MREQETIQDAEEPLRAPLGTAHLLHLKYTEKDDRTVFSFTLPAFIAEIRLSSSLSSDFVETVLTEQAVDLNRSHGHHCVI